MDSMHHTIAVLDEVKLPFFFHQRTRDGVFRQAFLIVGLASFSVMVSAEYAVPIPTLSMPTANIERIRVFMGNLHFILNYFRAETAESVTGKRPWS
jgi:hypothetical protein